MKVASLFSGGKDSTYALYVAQQRGWVVSDLVTLIPESADSLMYHVPNIHLAPKLSECLGIPLTQNVAGGGESGELEALKVALKEIEVDGVVTGAIASDYQKSRIDAVCDDLGLRCFSPIWRRQQTGLLDDYLMAGFRILIVGVAAEGFDRNWLGRELDEKAKEDLLALSRRSGVSPCGEGGEYESLVIDGPNYRKSLRIVESKVNWKGNSGILNVMQAETTEK